MKLGFWQLDRLEWKQGILDRIATNMAAQPVALDSIDARDEAEYRRVCAIGEFDHAAELYLFTTNLTGQAGYQVYTPLIREGKSPVLVNRGWVPGELKDPALRLDGQIAGPVTVCGVLRFERETGSFAADNDIEKRTWFHRDLKSMAEVAGLADPYKGFIDSDGMENPSEFPIGGQTRVNIPNNHLGYAVTWFGLAAALFGVFAVFAFQSRRKK